MVAALQVFPLLICSGQYREVVFLDIEVVLVD